MALRNGFAAAAILALLASLQSVSAAERARKPISQAEATVLIADLGNEDFARREAATRKLSQIGTEGIEHLVAAAQSDNAEIAWRALSAVEQVGAKCDEPTLAQLLKTLQPIDLADRSDLAALRTKLQERQAQFRHGRAVARVRSLGGEMPVISVEANEAPVFFAVGSGVVTEFVSGDVVVTVDSIELKDEPLDVTLAPVAPVAAVPVTVAAVEVASDAGPEQIEVAGPADPTPPPPVADELFDAAGEPAPPPDVLPVTPPGEVPPLEGEIADAFVGDDPPAEVGVAGPVDPRLPVSNDPVQRLSLTAAWRGGDAELAVLKDLPELQHLSLEHANVSDAGLEHVAALPNLAYLEVRGTKITSQGLQRLRAQKPSLIITAAGEAMLGVSAQEAGGRCQLTSVSPQSGAAKAGLKVGDFVTQVDDAKVTSFVDLMIAVFSRKPGDKLSVQYERDGEALTTVVELGARTVPPTVTR